MDFESFIKKMVETTHCKADAIGDEEFPEYQLTFNVADERKQEVNIFPFMDDDKHFIRVLTFIGKKSDFSQTQMVSFLELNMSLRYGALAIYQGQVAMTLAALHENETDEDRLSEQIQYLIRMADNFEKTLVGLDRK